MRSLNKDYGNKRPLFHQKNHQNRYYQPIDTKSQNHSHMHTHCECRLRAHTWLCNLSWMTYSPCDNHGHNKGDEPSFPLNGKQGVKRCLRLFAYSQTRSQTKISSDSGLYLRTAPNKQQTQQSVNCVLCVVVHCC